MRFPKTRGVRRQNFVGKNNSLRRFPEFEFRIGQDQSALLGMPRRALVKLKCKPAQLRGVLSPDQCLGVCERDVLIV